MAQIAAERHMLYDSRTVPVLRGLKLESVKDYVQIGVGLTAILGGLITGASLLTGGDAASSSVPPAATTFAVAAITETPPATATVAETDTPAPIGEFLRVQFGGQQDPNTLLPGGDTVSPDDTLEACPGESLYAWVYHNFPPGTVIDGRISDKGGVLFNAAMPVDPGASYFWISAQVTEPGPHTLLVRAQGQPISAMWTVTVTCPT
jgi:hypothetical protein